jgi:hypothetical protein
VRGGLLLTNNSRCFLVLFAQEVTLLILNQILLVFSVGLAGQFTIKKKALGRGGESTT